MYVQHGKNAWVSSAPCLERIYLATLRRTTRVGPSCAPKSGDGGGDGGKGTAVAVRKVRIGSSVSG